MSISRSGRAALWAEAAELADPPGPNAPPHTVDFYLYGGKYVYTWTNGDSSAQTEYTTDGTNRAATLAAGVSEWASGSSTFNPNFGVRHTRGGILNPLTGWVGVA